MHHRPRTHEVLGLWFYCRCSIRIMEKEHLLFAPFQNTTIKSDVLLAFFKKSSFWYLPSKRRLCHEPVCKSISDGLILFALLASQLAIASDGQDTLQIIEFLLPDIILFAIGNPGEQDLETMRELHERSPDALILALTSDEVPGQGQAVLEHGADAVLAKTAPRSELLHTLRVVIANMNHEENVSLSQRSETGIEENPLP